MTQCISPACLFMYFNFVLAYSIQVRICCKIEGKGKSTLASNGGVGVGVVFKLMTEFVPESVLVSVSGGCNWNFVFGLVGWYGCNILFGGVSWVGLNVLFDGVLSGISSIIGHLEHKFTSYSWVYFIFYSPCSAVTNCIKAPICTTLIIRLISPK